MWLLLCQVLTIVSGLEHFDARDVAKLDMEKYRQTCVDLVNSYRKEAGLPLHVRAKSNEACTQKHAAYDVVHGAHAGFKAHICAGKFATQNEAGTHGLGQDPMKHLHEVITKFAKGSGQHHKNQMGPSSKGLSCGFACGKKFCWATQDYSNHFDGMHQNITEPATSAAVLPEGTGINKTTADACQLPPASPPPSTGKFSRQECLNAINMYRGKKGLPSIKLCSAERQTLADRMIQYDGDKNSAHAYFKNCGGLGKGGTGQCEAGRFGSAAGAVKAYWNEGPPKKGGFNHYSIMMNAKNTCVACGFSQKNWNLGSKHQTWTYAHNFYSDGVTDDGHALAVLV